MNSRRSFFKLAASFVAGCALNVGAMVKPIKPESEYYVEFITHPHAFDNAGSGKYIFRMGDFDPLNQKIIPIIHQRPAQ